MMESVLKFEENIHYEQAEKPDIFRVTFMENEPAKERNLLRSFDLLVNTMNFSIVDLETNKAQYIWPFRYIRRYGCASTVFQFEAGRKCPSGEGFFSVSTKEGDGERIFESIQRKLKGIKQRDTSYKSIHDETATSPPATPSSLNSAARSRVPKQSSNELYENGEIIDNPRQIPVVKPKPTTKPGSLKKPPTAAKPSSFRPTSLLAKDPTSGDFYERVDDPVSRRAKPASPAKPGLRAPQAFSGAALNQLLSGMKQKLQTPDDESNYDSMSTMQRAHKIDEAHSNYGDLDYSRRAAHPCVDDDDEYSTLQYSSRY